MRSPRTDRASPTALATGLQDLFVAVALLTISVGLVLPGTIAHSSSAVMQSADRLATGTLRQLTSGLVALSRADLAGAHVRVIEPRVVVHTRDEIGAMATSFNTMIGEIERAAASLDLARERLRMHTEDLESQVVLRTAALEKANGELEAAELERGRLLDEAIDTLEKQRRSIAADLHDGPIQRLTAIGMMLDRAEGLRLGIAVRIGLEDVDLDPSAETTLYRVVQEALSNIARHASATTLVVTLRTSPDAGTAELVVEDDGVGIGAPDLRRLVRDGHFGLAGMRERLEMIGGRFEIDNPAVGGTRLRATVPGRVSGIPTPEMGNPPAMLTSTAGTAVASEARA